MKLILKIILFFSLICWIIAYKNIFDYTTIVTFGDSMSDTGNGYRISNKTWPSVPPFNSNGGFADGLLWNQILTQQFLTNTFLQDYSCGSATTDNRLVEGNMGFAPNLIANYSIRNNTKAQSFREQISEYINSTINKTINFDLILYVAWIGGNNYNFNKSLTPLDTVISIMDCLNVLILFGVKNLIVINEPPFDRFPEYRNKNTTNTTKYLFIQHNEILDKKITETYLLLNTRINIQLFDIYKLISKILDNYINYGFENLDNCWDTKSNSTIIIKCQNISKRIFADEYHLTSAVQTLIAKEFYFTFGGLNSTSIGTNLISNNLYLFFFMICIILILK